MKMGLLHNRISRLCCHVNWYKKKPMQFQNKQTKGCWKIDCLLVVWPLFQALRKYPWKTTIISTSMDGLQSRYWMWIWKARSYVKRSPNFCFRKNGGLTVRFTLVVYYLRSLPFPKQGSSSSSPGVSILQKAKKGPEGVDDYKKAPSGKLVVALESIHPFRDTLKKCLPQHFLLSGRGSWNFRFPILVFKHAWAWSVLKFSILSILEPTWCSIVLFLKQN